MGFYTRMKEERAKREAMGPQPKYRVLQASLLKQADREKVAAVISTIKNVEDALQLAGTDSFAYMDLDLRRNVGALTYKKVQVALLYKREITELEPGPADPIPMGSIEDPMDAWIVVDLLDMSQFARNKGTRDRLQQALQQVNRLQMLWENSEREKQVAIEALKKTDTLREEHRSFREKVSLMEKEKEVTTKEIESLHLVLKKEKEERKNDKLKMVAEMFPVFNTVWLAGLHRVADTLYGMLKKQLVDALTKIGIALVEPKVGDEFDPTLQHAIHGKSYPKDAPEIGKVVEVHRFGWRLVNGPVYAAADVSVGVEEKDMEDAVKNGSGSS